MRYFTDPVHCVQSKASNNIKGIWRDNRQKNTIFLANVLHRVHA